VRDGEEEEEEEGWNKRCTCAEHTPCVQAASRGRVVQGDIQLEHSSGQALDSLVKVDHLDKLSVC
jgi:hypothetical protein